MDLVLKNLKPKVGYKHISPENYATIPDGLDTAEAFLKARSIRICPYKALQKIEGFRQDQTEGWVNNTHRPKSGPVDFETALILMKMGFPNLMGKNMAVVLEGNNWPSEGAPSMVFCASFKPDEGLRKKGNRIFKITDLSAFAETLTPCFTRPVGAPAIGYVEYSKQSGIIPFNQARFDPFKKPNEPRFVSENEVRIAWPAGSYGQNCEDPQYLDCAAAAAFIEEV